MKLEKDFWPVLVIACVVAFFVARFVGLMSTTKNIGKAIANACDNVFNLTVLPPVIPTPMGLMIAFVVFLLILYVYFHYKTRGTYRRGEEHGSSKWISKDEIRKYGDQEVPLDNVILAQEVRLRYRRGDDYNYEKNRNILLIGGSGSGKTRGYYKPNIMQVPAPELAGKLKVEDLDHYARSFFITDPKGTTRAETGYVVAEHGYKVKEFNLINPDVSLGYNPIKYIRSEEDVMSFATCLIKNTTPPDAGKGGDPFWENSEKLLYQALIEYMMTEVPKEDRNFITLCELLDLGQVDPTTNAMSGLDILFSELETGKRYDPDVESQSNAVGTEKDLKAVGNSLPNPWKAATDRQPQPNHPAVLAYRSFKSGATETLQSIFISCKVRLAPLRPKKIQRILATDEMELDKFGEERIACYAVMSANDPTYNFLFAMMIWQLFNEMMRQGALKYGDSGGALPVGVDFLLDEFANYYIPNFEQTISVIRSYNIGAHIGVQSTSQLKDKYGEENSITITNNCDTIVFLGGKANDTNEELSKIMGQQTVTTDNESNTHAENSSWSEQIAQHGRDLLQPSEIAKMPKSEGLVLIQGADPYRGPKFDVTSHPLYDYIDPKPGRKFERAFDFAAYHACPDYYKHDKAKLEVTSTARLYLTSPPILNPPRKRAFVVLMQTTVENVGEDTAYNVRGHIAFDCACASNAPGRPPKYPLMEPFGTASGLKFKRTETYTNFAPIFKQRGLEDKIEWSDANDSYTLEGVNIDPGKRIIYTTALEVSVKEIIAKMGNIETGYYQPNAEVAYCDFDFDYNFDIKCANFDSIHREEKRRLTVANNGNAKLYNLEDE